MGLFGRGARAPGGHPVAPPPPARQQGGPAAAAAVTVISRQNRIEGTILGTGDVRIDGQLKGAVDLSGQLVVSDSGLIDGTVIAKSVVVAGSMIGDVTAIERIELNPTAKVQGNITAPRILIHDGASFNGQVFMKEPDARPGAEPQPPITTSSARREPGEPRPDPTPGPTAAKG
jgi:cytoskeletal protein CcmA (bactofilin family)